jgi:hypothetical protein
MWLRHTLNVMKMAFYRLSAIVYRLFLAANAAAAAMLWVIVARLINVIVVAQNAPVWLACGRATTDAAAALCRWVIIAACAATNAAATANIGVIIAACAAADAAATTGILVVVGAAWCNAAPAVHQEEYERDDNNDYNQSGCIHWVSFIQP